MKKIHKNKVFEGEHAIGDFLTPGSMGPTPLVELPASLNPFTKDKVRIFIKLVNLVPLFNIKSQPAHMMLDNIPRDELKKIKNLVEYSSGNTALSLAVLAQYFGIEKMYAIITPDVPESKKRILRLVGTNLLISHGPKSPDVKEDVGGIYDAKLMGQKPGWHNLHQYINPGNWEAGEEYVGKELWQQLGTELSFFTSSIGTAGTITGAGKYLKSKNKKLKVLGVAVKEGSSIPGPRGEVMIHKLGIEWQNTVDEVSAVETFNAFKSGLDLIRAGFFVGPSTGMQLSALLDKIREYKKKGQLKNLKNENGEVVSCFIACDSMFPYIDEYFDNLPDNLFPRVKDLPAGR